MGCKVGIAIKQGRKTYGGGRVWVEKMIIKITIYSYFFIPCEILFKIAVGWLDSTLIYFNLFHIKFSNGFFMVFQ